MYIIIKNDKQALSNGLTGHTWKYLDECKEAAEQATEDTKATISICELKPLYTYNLEIICTENKEKEPPNDEPANDEPTDEPKTPEPDEIDEPTGNDEPTGDDEPTNGEDNPTETESSESDEETQE